MKEMRIEKDEVSGSIKQPKNCNTAKQKLWRAVSNPWWLGGFFLRKLSPLIKNDAFFMKWEYFFGMKKFPNLKTPRTYNEKIQWMKLHDRNPEYAEIVDKFTAKDYVQKKLGTSQYNIPTLGVWDAFEEIDFDLLPNQFVLKTTHDSGGVAICRDKRTFDKGAAAKKLNKSLRHNYYLEHREWPYKQIKPRIIAEQYIGKEGNEDIKDYKFFCFNGEPRFLFIASDRATNTHFDFYDLDFNHLPFTQGHPWSPNGNKRPANFEEMKQLARRLAEGFHQVRVDLYCIGDKIYFGELTFFHFSGNVPFSPETWDLKIGEMWELPNFNNNKAHACVIQLG